MEILLALAVSCFGQVAPGPPGAPASPPARTAEPAAAPAPGDAPVPTAPADRGAELFGIPMGPWWATIPIFLLLWGLLTYGLWVLTVRFIAGIVFSPGRRAVELTLKGLHMPLVVLFGLAGLYVVLDSNAVPSDLAKYGDKVLITAVALTLVAAAVRLSGGFIDELATRYPGFTPLYTPAHYASRVVLVGVGVLVWLQAVGVPVSALLGAAGILGAALVLGVQDTLRNFVGGVHLLLDRPLRIGDVVTLEDGTTATVISIGWRSARLLRADHSMIVIPNRALAEQRIVNHSLPQKWIFVTIPVRLPREVDLAHAEALMRDELTRAVEEIPALRRDPPPYVSPSPGYTPTHLELTVAFAVNEFKNQRPVSDELLRRLNDRLRTEGVGFASPRSPATDA
jgi:small-conductance mechanosensitive channel